MSEVYPIDPRQLGERLRLARASARRTQEQAADQIGISRTTIVAIEKGERRASIEEISALASFYNTTCNALLSVAAPIISFVPQFRVAPTLTGVEEPALVAVQLLERLAIAFSRLARLVGFASKPNLPSPFHLLREHVIEQAEDAALAFRSHIGSGLSPIPDLQSVLETQLSFRIFLRPLDSRISGVYGYAQEVGPCILLNSLHPESRRQISAAHETGHFMSTREAVDVTLGDVQEADLTSERFANRFASALLMPATAIRQHFAQAVSKTGKFSPRHIIYLAHGFHVSLEAMTRRLETLRLIKRGTWDALRDQGFGRAEVSEVLGQAQATQPIAKIDRVSLLAAEAHAQGLLTEGQLAELLSLDRPAVRKMLDDLNSVEANYQIDAQ